MRNVARFRIRGQGLKCETGLYGRSPDRSAICVKTGIQEKHVFFHVSVPNIYGTSSSIYLVIFLKVISKKITQFSAAVDLFDRFICWDL